VALAFFDLDRTLLSVNSATLWVRREVALGFVRKRDAFRAALWLARYQLGFVNAEGLVEEAVAQLAGTRVADLKARTRRFYEAEVKPTYRPGGLEALAWHRGRGDRPILLTSSSLYLSELVAADLGIEEILCTRFEADAEGFHTGRVVGRACFGAGKLAYAQASAARHGVALEDCTFYTDSFSDLPVLERVGRPVAVNPDPRLRRLATKRGWPVTDWGTPEGDVRRGEVA
jgi:HAD superfamily hydrolase (TIGR01490 family)